MSYSQIDAEIAQLGKENGKPELTVIAKELGLSGSYKTKKEAQTAIHRLIAERKESFQRTQFGGR